MILIAFFLILLGFIIIISTSIVWMNTRTKESYIDAEPSKLSSRFNGIFIILAGLGVIFTKLFIV